MDARKLLGIMLGITVAAAAGCSAGADDAGGDDAEAQEGQLRPLERKAIGRAVDYPADKTLRAKLPELEASRKL